MHYRMIVLTAKENAKTSQEARNYVTHWLEDNGFCEQGRFTSGQADWFVIGGRWSGDLSRARLDAEKIEECDKEFEKKYGWFTGGKEKVTDIQRQHQYATVFMKYFPDYKGMLPAWRDSYKHDGFEDDAQIVDKELWEKLIKNILDDQDPEHFCYTEDSDAPKEEKKIVNKVWAVVVDYHN